MTYYTLNRYFDSMIPLPGATVEITETGFAVIRHAGYLCFAKLDVGEVGVFKALEEARKAIEADAVRKSEQTRVSRDIIRARAVSAGS